MMRHPLPQTSFSRFARRFFFAALSALAATGCDDASSEIPSETPPAPRAEATPPAPGHEEEAVAGAEENAEAADERPSDPAGGEGAQEGSLRMVVLSEGELLGSEQRLIDRLASALDDAGFTTVRANDDADAIDYLSVIAADSNYVRPASWAAAEHVLIVRIATPYTGRAARRTSRGISELAFIETSSGTFRYHEQNEDSPVVSAQHAEAPAAIASLLRLLETHE